MFFICLLSPINSSREKSAQNGKSNKETIRTMSAEALPFDCFHISYQKAKELVKKEKIAQTQNTVLISRKNFRFLLQLFSQSCPIERFFFCFCFCWFVCFFKAMWTQQGEIVGRSGNHINPTPNTHTHEHTLRNTHQKNGLGTAPS